PAVPGAASARRGSLRDGAGRRSVPCAAFLLASARSERQSAEGTDAVVTQGRRLAVAAPVPRSAGEPANGAGRRVPRARLLRLDRQQRTHRGRELLASDGRRLCESDSRNKRGRRKKRCKIRCSKRRNGAKSGAVSA